MCVCVCLRAIQPFVQDMFQRPRTVCQRTVFLRQGFIGFMQCIIRREGRGLCFDRVTAAGGGAEFVVVSRRMLSAPAPADGDRALLLHPTS